LIEAKVLFEIIYKDVMPNLFFDEFIDRSIYFESYLNTYLERDI